MGAFKNFINDLSIDDKIDLIVDNKLWNKSVISNVDWTDKLLLIDLEQLRYDSEIFSLIARSWDLDLVEQYAKIKSLTNNQNTNLVVIPFGKHKTKGVNFKGIDELYVDDFFAEKMLSHYVRTLKKMGFLIAAYIGEGLNKKSLELIQKMSDLIIVEGNQHLLIKEIKNNDILTPVLMRNLNDGAELVIYNELTDKYDSKSELLDAITLYDEKKLELDSDLTLLPDFNLLLESGSIVSAENIDELINDTTRLVNEIYKNKSLTLESRENTVELKTKFLNILIKNSTVFYRGDYNIQRQLAKSNTIIVGDFSYYNGDLVPQLILEEASSKYFAKKVKLYSKSDILTNANITDSVEEIIDKTAIININESNEKLSEHDIEVIDLLNSNNYKIILVINENIKYIDIDWFLKCNVVLTAKLIDETSLAALFDFIGRDNEFNAQLIDPVLIEEIGSGEFIPFFGLTNNFSSVSDLKIDGSDITFNVSNNASLNTHMIFKIYLNNKDNSDVSRIQIAYHKIFLNAKNNMNIKIEIKKDVLLKHDINNSAIKNGLIEIVLPNLTTIQIRPAKANVKKEFIKTKSKANILSIVTLLYINLLFAFVLVSIGNSTIQISLVILLIIIDVILLRLFKKKGSRLVQEINKQQILDSVLSMPYLEATSEHIYEDEMDYSNLNIDDTLEKEDETTEVEKIIRPKEIIKTDYIYDHDLTIVEYTDLLTTYMKNSGLEINIGTTRQLFSALATSHLIVSNQNNSEVIMRLFEIYTQFVGANLYYENLSNNNPSLDALVSRSNNDLIDCLNTANIEKDKMHFMILNNVDINQIDNNFSKLMDYAIDPLIPVSVKVAGKNDTMEIPANVWFIIIPQEQNKFIRSKEFAASSVRLNFDYKLVSPKERLNENAFKQTYRLFKDYVKNVKKVFHLDEQEWKKLDNIELNFTKHTKLTFDNRLIRAIEGYTAMYIATDGEHLNALDSVLVAKIIPYLEQFDIFEPKDEDDIESNGNMADLIDKLFGLENLIKTQNTLLNIKDNNSKGDL